MQCVLSFHASIALSKAKPVLRGGMDCIILQISPLQKRFRTKEHNEGWFEGDLENVIDIQIFMRGVDFLQNSSISLILSIMSLILRKYVNSFICLNLNIMSNIYIKRII